jgi:hypothetical protein
MAGTDPHMACQHLWRFRNRHDDVVSRERLARRRILRVTSIGPLVVVAGVLLQPVRPAADEGMWTFDNLPRAQLKDKYKFEPSQAWLDHLRLSSIRFNDGGSGAFISPRGLVLTNHHVAVGQLQKVSSAKKDYVKNGFFASAARDELKCPDLELNILESLEDVTARIKAAVKPGMTAAAALDARRAAIATIEEESLDRSGLRSDVVKLYQGGEYWLYRYRRYTDVRLVFAPEQQAAFFGGDADNFTYPRYDLDFALFRAYDQGKPVASDHHLKWNPKGADEGELVFVSGHPGSTDRLETVASLTTLRDSALPRMLEVIERRLKALEAFASGGAEQARQAQEDIFGLENARKAYQGELAGLKDPAIWSKKEREEREFRTRIESKPEWKAYAAAWDKIGDAEQKSRSMANDYFKRTLGGSHLANLALTLVRYVEETRKPDGERLEEFREAQRPALDLQLFSPAPVYPGLEQALFETALQHARDVLGPDDEFIKAALQGRSPAEVAHDVMHATRLTDVAVRKALVQGGPGAVQQSTDLLLVFVRRVDPILRAARKRVETEIDSVKLEAGETLGHARFDAYGKSVYPDATFTLRLSYGTVKGYPMNGTIAAPKTTFYGLFDRATAFGLGPPFDLPARFLDRQGRLKLETPLNFVTTNDIAGGNSGSPIVNRAGELVGLVFDGNIESLVGSFVYDDLANRTVAVHSAAILHALRVLYDAGTLADELEGRAVKTVSRR